MKQWKSQLFRGVFVNIFNQTFVQLALWIQLSSSAWLSLHLSVCDTFFRIVSLLFFNFLHDIRVQTKEVMKAFFEKISHYA